MGDYGLLGCCLKEKCTTGIGPRGAQTCDARNYFMDSEGVRKADRDSMIGFGHSAPRGTKRAIDVAKEQANAVSIAGVQASFTLTDCIQTCRAFQAGRCIKYHDDNLSDGHPRKCPETHDMAKKEIKCCSILVPGDKHYKKGSSRAATRSSVSHASTSAAATRWTSRRTRGRLSSQVLGYHVRGPISSEACSLSYNQVKLGS